MIGPYQTITGVACRSWATGNRATLVRFIRVQVAALDWLFDPVNRSEAVAIYRKYLPNVPEAAAPRHVDALVGEREGLVPKGQLDPEGLNTVLRIRSEFGRPQKQLDDAGRYIDESYYREALP